jgi:anhydro-N-acetylmuramic acid kinase
MIERWRACLAKPERRIVGLMSGTSMDGIDVAVVRVAGSGTATRVVLEHFECVAYAPALRQRLVASASGAPVPAAEHARLHFDVARAFATAVLETLARAGIAVHDVDAIGSHGQTLFHHGAGRGADDAQAATWQAGSLPVLSALTGIAVVGDFRPADVALGGTGAPLVPYVDFLLRRSAVENRIVLNLGGIANLTYLGAGAAAEDVLAWDTGPANLALDGLAQALFGVPYDRDGALAAGGRADPAWVEALLADAYFHLPAPKSAGREQFGAAYVARLLAEGRRRGAANADVLAVAVEVAAGAVARALAAPPIAALPVDAVYATGGGRRNATLLRRLGELLSPVRVDAIEALGDDGDAKEAVDFAVLANETLHGHAGNLVRVTGARRSCVLGAVADCGGVKEAVAGRATAVPA